MPYFTWKLPTLLVFFGMAIVLSACDKAAPQQGGMPAVTYLSVTTQSITLTTELAGRTSAYMISDVRPQVSGIIQERLFIEGSDVKQGEVLYQIDPSLYQAAFDNAKATLKKAEANAVAARLLAERYRKIVKVNAVSKQEYDNAVASQGQADAEVAAAKAALDTARINLNYTKVTAPVSGRIGRSSVTPGALVTQNQADALATVQQLDPIYVDVTQSSTDLLRLKRAFASGALKSSGEAALQVRLKLEDGTMYTHRQAQTNPAKGEEGLKSVPIMGTLKFSEVSVDQSTGMVTIRALFPNPDGTLLPGMYVHAVLEEGVKEDAILLPQKAVIRNNRGLPVAHVLSKNATLQSQEGVYNTSPRTLTVDRAINNHWLVTGGLAAGDLVILEGLQRIRPGAPVKAEQDPGPVSSSSPSGASSSGNAAR